MAAVIEHLRSGASANITRRSLLRTTAVIATATALPAMATRSDSLAMGEWVVSAHGDSGTGFGVGWLNAESGVARSAPLGYRAHDVLAVPGHATRVLAIARRPGVEATLIDLETGDTREAFRCSPGNHLYGHACFSADGAYLYTTENRYNTGEGTVVVRDASNWTVVDEWNSAGIGPHEIRLLPDRETLVVANGGLQTHPDSGRTVLNGASMRSSLSYHSSATGELLENVEVSEPAASIRHMAVAADSTVALGMQVQRQFAGHSRPVPVAAMHRRGQAITLLEAPGALLDAMNDYVGSVALSNRSRLAGFASPRGNLAVFWHLDTGDYAGHHRLGDVCGISCSGQSSSFLLSNSSGDLRVLDEMTLAERVAARQHHAGFRWDNHLSLVESVNPHSKKSDGKRALV